MKAVMNIRKIITEDGSDSLYAPELDETYHSKHGAISESEHVFIKNGLQYLIDRHNPEKLNILEFGFGTGLNVLLSLITNDNVTITYTSLEKYPIEPATARQLNYGNMLGHPELFRKILDCPWESWQSISDEFKLLKRKVDFIDFEPDSMYDLIYFDAFAPSKQPELWSFEMMKKCSEGLNPKGAFVTYSAKGQIRRDLQNLGLTVERLPGPPGKFEMLRATKI